MRWKQLKTKNLFYQVWSKFFVVLMGFGFWWWERASTDFCLVWFTVLYEIIVKSWLWVCSSVKCGSESLLWRQSKLLMDWLEQKTLQIIELRREEAKFLNFSRAFFKNTSKQSPQYLKFMRNHVLFTSPIQFFNSLNQIFTAIVLKIKEKH